VAVLLVAILSLPAQEKVTPPGGQPPQFFVVTATDKDGLVIQRRPPSGKATSDVPLIEYKVAFKSLRATDARGKALASDEVARRLKVGMVVLVSADDQPVPPTFLSVVKDDTVILIDVLPQPRGEPFKPKE